MWIKSQNGDVLLNSDKISGFNIEFDRNIYALVNGDEYIIGTFDTKEIAKQELDNIFHYVMDDILYTVK